VADWDEDSRQLRQNPQAFAEIVRLAERRATPALETARKWQRVIMQGLDVPDPQLVGSFRGEPGLETSQVQVGVHKGVNSADVAEALARFEEKLQRLAAELDAHLPIEQEPDADQLAAIIDLCAWVHAEWVRIHPFVNGNGRTARLWANSIAMRYGLPPFVRLRPRPNTGYGDAGAKAMQGDWKPASVAFRRMLADLLDEL
jgi:Fic family protein